MTTSTEVTAVSKSATETAIPLSRIIPINSYSDEQRKKIQAVVTYLNERENATVLIKSQTIAVSATTHQMFTTLDRTLETLLELIESGRDVSSSKIQTTFRSTQGAVSREFDPKVIARKQARAARDEAEAARNREPAPLELYYEFADSENSGLYDKLARHLSKAPTSRDSISEFSSIGNAEIVLENKKIKVGFPFYEDPDTTAKQKEIILTALTYLSQSIDTLPHRHFTKAHVKRAIESAKKYLHKPETAPTAVQTAEKPKEVTSNSFTVTKIGKNSAADWASEIVGSGRIANLRAFKENPDLNFDVTIAYDKENCPIGFTIKLPPKEKIDTNQIVMAHYVLEQLQAKWEKFPNSSKVAVAGWLKEIWKEVDQQSEIDHGDYLSLEFQKKAKPKELSVYTPTFNDRAQSIEQGDLTPKSNFELGLFATTGSLVFTRESGRTETITPTPNQWKLINAILDPNIKAVVVKGPAGTGKTLFASYAGLLLLKFGHMWRLLYDRPLEGAGGRTVGYLKGDLEEKVGPFHGPFEKVFAKLLGAGNIPLGQSRFKELQDIKTIERYDEIFKRGDNIEDSLLIIDEGQNKTRDELYHLLTRPDENSKVVIMGDGEFQIDLKNKNSSGLIEAEDIYGNIHEYAFIQLEDIDIKRSPLVQKTYRARRDFEAREKAQREMRSQPRTQISAENAHSLPPTAPEVTTPAPKPSL